MAELIKFEVASSIDGSQEMNLLLPPAGKQQPLLVVLHTWSAEVNSVKQAENVLPFVEERGWGLLVPNFRGPNLTTNPRAKEACASSLARQDVLDAVAAVREKYEVRSDAIFCFGGSGGGHMSLMMAAAAPELWRGVSAWCPITDLAQWHGENPNYSAHIEACCGGKPGESMAIDAEYAARSPVSHVGRLARATVWIHHGLDDPSVPCTHSLNLFCKVKYTAPGARCWLDIHPGGHDCHCDRAMEWFAQLAGNAEKKGMELTK